MLSRSLTSPAAGTYSHSMDDNEDTVLLKSTIASLSEVAIHKELEESRYDI
jgi:hypothetical protein